MDAELMIWKDEMEKMLAAINRQTAHSLRIIRLIFKRCGRSLPPEFKEYFLQTSSYTIKATYEQFELDSVLEEPFDVNLNSAAKADGRLSNKGQSGLQSGAGYGQNDIQIDNLSDDEIVIEANKSGQKLFFRPMEVDDVYGTNELIDHQSNRNENYIIDPEFDSDLNFVVEMDGSTDSIGMVGKQHNIALEVKSESSFTVEMDESDDSIEMVGSQNDSTDADDNELTRVNVGLDRLDETTPAGLFQGKMAPLNRKNPNKKRMMITKKTNQVRNSSAIKDEKSPPKQSLPRNQKRCSICGFVGSAGNFSRHMRIHSGENQYRCDRCGRSFTRAATLINHAATHIAEFPFHCRACFRGFSLKAEAMDHEKQCQQRHFECYLCTKLATTLKYDLIKHMRTHTGDKPFRCEICMKRFVQRSHLKTHLKTIHTNTSA